MDPDPRTPLLTRLREDLIGPLSADEVLSARPTDTYLTGILWPEACLFDAEEDDERTTQESSGEETSTEAEAVPNRRALRPATIGLSLAVRGHAPQLQVTLQGGSYRFIGTTQEREELGGRWARQPLTLDTVLDIRPGYHHSPLELPEFPGTLQLAWKVVPWQDDTWLVTVVLVNTQVASTLAPEERDEYCLFQAGLRIVAAPGSALVPRPGRSADLSSPDPDRQSAALLYRQMREYAVGHTVAAAWSDPQPDGSVAEVRTTWLPQARVYAVSADGHPLLQALQQQRDTAQLLRADWLARQPLSELTHALAALPRAYDAWIAEQQARLPELEPDYRPTAERHLEQCRQVRRRIQAAVDLIARDETVARAFQLANAVMDRQRRPGWQADQGEGLTWRPFQLAFLLLVLPSLTRGDHPDRQIMDLLWFPTGGGKTEAYLGLIAFLLFHRRLRQDEPDQGAGTAVIMRYTLRLLTAQQFERAAAVILCAEWVRRGGVEMPFPQPPLGQIPFSIGMWVGGDATPNQREEAVRALKGDAKAADPRQLQNCPCCRQPLDWQPLSAKAFEVRCRTPDCRVAGLGPLPVYTCDEDIYSHRPALVIGTVDKFAQIVRKAETGRLFGLPEALPPDLILQDELHLISGPLGTLAGLYETAIDRLCQRGDGAQPKVIGSTATIRRAESQVRALFNRETCQFPPPGLDSTDSCFAVQDPSRWRLYAAVTTAGRSAKVSLQHVSASLLQSAAGAFSEDAARDPYWTQLTYFNNLRELGGSLLLMQDVVPDTIGNLADRRRESRRRVRDVDELTSRLSQQEVLGMLDRLDGSVSEGALDVVLATNMVSVGVDISRLGLMVVQGQPKGISEYIQATSRVGRSHPGLVVSVLNSHRIRDRSRFETFASWHETLYRDVEPTSVTPFAARARDRALHAVLVALVRHLVPGLADSPQLGPEHDPAIQEAIAWIRARCRDVDSAEEEEAARQLQAILQDWEASQPEEYWYNRFRKPAPCSALLISAEEHATWTAADTDATLRPRSTPNSLRNVEPGVQIGLIE